LYNGDEGASEEVQLSWTLARGAECGVACKNLFCPASHHPKLIWEKELYLLLQKDLQLKR